MTIKDLREILIHFQDKKYDDYEVVLWDCNQQKELCLESGYYSLSHPKKKLNFPVDVPVDSEMLLESLKKMKDDLEG